MIRLIQRMGLAAVALIAGGNAFAYDFKVGDVYYNILSETDRAVEVTSDGSAYSYMGDVTIPDKVAYEGVTYAVTNDPFECDEHRGICILWVRRFERSAYFRFVGMVRDKFYVS